MRVAQILKRRDSAGDDSWNRPRRLPQVGRGESARRRRSGRRPRTYTLCLALLLSLSLLGCGLTFRDAAQVSLDAARVSLTATGAVYEAAEPRLEAQRKADGQACLDGPALAAEPCVATVRAKWKPIREASEHLYRAIVAALAVLHLAEASQALGAGIDVAKLGAALAAALDAAGAFRRAISPAAAVP